ncbi:hypothetical protein HJC23_001214 [Cyclotella cryptica]|uniref:Uncharacterized protein n=1 Tax=Cyclotella cryptica TaxID=29204 RepID=A0ABD3QNF8_9STRA
MEDNDSSRKSGEILQEKLPKSIQSTGTRFHTETDDVAPNKEFSSSSSRTPTTANRTTHRGPDGKFNTEYDANLKQLSFNRIIRGVACSHIARTTDITKQTNPEENLRNVRRVKTTPDVDAEAWWDKRGTRHRSWLKGGMKYGGGDFESLRYLEEGSGGNALDVTKKKALTK